MGNLANHNRPNAKIGQKMANSRAV